MTQEVHACIVAVVWLMEEASGPVQLHRSAMVTVLDEVAAPAGVAGITATLTEPATASDTAANTTVTFKRPSTCTPPGLPAPFRRRIGTAPLVYPLGLPGGDSDFTVPDYIDPSRKQDGRLLG